MKYFSLVLLLSLSYSTFTLAQHTLRIEISDLRNSKGQILLEFNDESDQVLKGLTAEIVDKKSTVTIEDLEQGTYAFKYFHDENKDGKLNTNMIGMPKEGFGFSNNAKGKFGPPQFHKMLFEFKQSDTLKCIPTYLQKK